MKKFFLAFFIGLASSIKNSNNIYLYGTSLNTKGVSNRNGVNASETTTHSLDDVSQSKTYASGDDEVNARTTGQTIWTKELQGVNTDGTAIQTGQGNTLADSWSKSYTPTRENYLNNYYSYVKFLTELFPDIDSQEISEDVANRLNESIANYENPDMDYQGQRSFDLQQARASGYNTAASTKSGTFNWGKDNTMQKGHGFGSADNGWATTNNSNWLHSRGHYLTANKNAAAFGENVYSQSNSDSYVNGDSPYVSGKAWGDSAGHDAVTYSNVNANQFGFGALSGGTNTYSDQVGSQSVSEIRGNPYGATNVNEAY